MTGWNCICGHGCGDHDGCQNECFLCNCLKFRPAGSITETENALRLSLAGVEAVWLSPQGQMLFQIDLAGVVDDEPKLPRYLKVRK